MKQRLNRVIAILCMVALIVTMMPANIMTAKAASMKGTKINVNQMYTGNLATADQVDWYTFDITQQGYFQVELGPKNSGDKNIESGWRITVYDQNENELKTVSNIISTTVSPKLPFAPGSYYVKVSADTPNVYYAPIDCTYNLKVNTVETSIWESEENDTMTDADVINPDSVHSGNLYKAEDVDYYKVTTAKNGYFTIELAPETFGAKNIENGWTFTVYDQNKKELKTVSNIKSTTVSPKLPFAPGSYYVKVSADTPNVYYAPIDCTYQLKINTIRSSIWESEKNDTKKTADKITLNKKNYYKGTSYHGSDEDFYKFTLPAKGKIKVSFKAEDFSELPSENYGWNLYVYNASGSKKYELGEFIQLKNKYLELNKGTYYLKVVPSTSSSYYAPVDVNYNLKVSYTKTPAKPTITKISSKKKTATVKWKKVANATGYKVFAKVGKNGKYKVVKTIKNNKTTSFTHKKLKKGKTYYYKIQAYTTKNGMTTKSVQSKYKAIVIK